MANKDSKERLFDYKSTNVLFKDKNVLFGAGGYGITYLEELQKVGIKIDYFCDNNQEKWGKEIQNIQVISPEKLVEISKKQIINIIISSAYEEEIYKQLESANINIRIYRGLIFDLNIINDLKMITKTQMGSWIENIKSVQAFLSDKRSIFVLENVKNYILTFDPQYIDIIEYGKDTQYFIKEIIEYLSDKNVVDCGAFTGDTIEVLIKDLNIAVKHIYAFEAAYDNYSELIKTINKLSAQKLVTPIMQGVWHQPEKLFMSHKKGAGSKVTNEKGSITIDLIDLDGFFSSDVNIGFIKMDIEGSELNALKGAKEIIQRDRPILAICIYHSLTEYVSIPLYLRELLYDYSFIIRHHYYRLAETVLYCIPNEIKEERSY